MFDRIQASQAAKVAILIAFGFTIVLIFISQMSKDTQSDVNSDLESIAEKLSAVPANRMRKVGGLGDVREKDETVVDVVNQIKPLLEEQTGKKYSSLEVIHYKTQVVAGTNYFVKVDAKEADTGKESVIHLRIYKDLERKLELTAYQLDKPRDEELRHFEP